VKGAAAQQEEGEDMQHLDEGTIHAWLDGQLPPDEAQAVDAHVADCRECADAVAEARGLIAASSRILLALDNVPGEVIPDTTPATRLGTAPVVSPDVRQHATQKTRRWFNNVSFAAAATILVAIGTVAVLRSRNQMPTSALTRMDEARRSRSSADSATPLATPRNEPVVANASPPPAASARAPQKPPSIVPSEKLAKTEASSVLGGAAAGNDGRQRDQAAAPQRAATPAEEDRLKADAIAKDRKAELSSLALAEKRAGVLQPSAFRDSAGAGFIRGRITDANNTGISDAAVTVAGTTTGGTTNARGEFTLGGVSPGSTTLTVRRIGFEQATKEIVVASGQTATADVVLRPATLQLESVVTTGTAVARRDAAGAQASKPAAPASLAPATSVSSPAIGCYQLGITSGTPSRTGFRQVPRNLSLDPDIVPGTPDGIWYRARDVARTGPTMPNGRWRPVAADTVELLWTNGSLSDRVRLFGQPGSMMRGNVEEIDSKAASGEAGAVVAVRVKCE
jgi:hypothetical protein